MTEYDGVERSTATETFRAMLDERGVEYKDRDMCGKHVFHWGEPLHGAMFTDGGEWTELVVENASPEQAIAATLGMGTCHEVWLLMATDVGNGREEVLGVYSSEGAAEAAASEDSYGYAFRNVQRWEVYE